MLRPKKIVPNYAHIKTLHPLLRVGKKGHNVIRVYNITMPIYIIVYRRNILHYIIMLHLLMILKVCCVDGNIYIYIRMSIPICHHSTTGWIQFKTKWRYGGRHWQIARSTAGPLPASTTSERSRTHSHSLPLKFPTPNLNVLSVTNVICCIWIITYCLGPAFFTAQSVSQLIEMNSAWSNAISPYWIKPNEDTVQARASIFWHGTQCHLMSSYGCLFGPSGWRQ